MIANSQQALSKANELVSFYSQYLPEDYFNDETEEDDDENDDEEEEEEEDAKSDSGITG